MVVDGDVAIRLQRQACVTATGFINVRINSDVTALVATRSGAVCQNGDAGSVVQLIVDTGVADLRALSRRRERGIVCGGILSFRNIA